MTPTQRADNERIPRDMINERDFSRLAWKGLEQWSKDVDSNGDIDGMTLEMWAYLWFRLRAAEDRDEWFPRGKWATIQHLESLLMESLR